MTWPVIAVQHVRERTTTTVLIPLTESDGDPVQAVGLTSVLATLTVTLPYTVVFADRDVKAGLVDGVLSVELTADDLIMVSPSQVELRVLTISITYGTGREWHLDIPIHVQQLVGVS